MTTRLPIVNIEGNLQELPSGDAISAASSILLSVLNQTGVTITKGSVVYITGANNGTPTVSLASASSDALSNEAVGLVFSDIAAGDIGTVVTHGALSGVNTSTATAGQSIWLSTIAGKFTVTKPTPPDSMVLLGTVLNSSVNSGRIFIEISTIQAPTTGSGADFDTAIIASIALG